MSAGETPHLQNPDVVDPYLHPSAFPGETAADKSCRDEGMRAVHIDNRQIVAKADRMRPHG